MPNGTFHPASRLCSSRRFRCGFSSSVRSPVIGPGGPRWRGWGSGSSGVASLCLGGGGWARVAVFSGPLRIPADAAAGTAIEMLIGGAVLVVIGPLSGERWSALTMHASADSLLALGYLALFGSILAFTAYVWLLQHAPISQISTYAYVNPVVAVPSSRWRSDTSRCSARSSRSRPT